MSDLFGPTLADGDVSTDAVTARPVDVRTVGALDTWFADCSSETEDDGTAIRADFLNGLLDLVRTLARGNGTQADGATPVLSDGNVGAQLLLAVQHLIQRGRMSVALDQGSANHVVVALSPVPAELADGMEIVFKAAADNTGPADLTVTGTTMPVTLPGNPAFTGGEIRGGVWHACRIARSGNNFAAQIVGPVKPLSVANIIENAVFSTQNLAAESVTAFRSMTLVTPVQAQGSPVPSLTFTFSVPEEGPALVTFSAQVGYAAGPQGMIIRITLDGATLIDQIGGTAANYYTSPSGAAPAHLTAGQHTIVVNFSSASADNIYDQALVVLLGAR